MSYARWGYSDVYVFQDVSGGVTCCGCKYAARHDDGRWDSISLFSDDEVYSHFQLHEKDGDDMPEGMVTQILADAITEPKYYLPYVEQLSPEELVEHELRLQRIKDKMRATITESVALAQASSNKED